LGDFSYCAKESLGLDANRDANDLVEQTVSLIEDRQIAGW
jgi:hypothetical protein